jgi:hypothetical protein
MEAPMIFRQFLDSTSGTYTLGSRARKNVRCRILEVRHQVKVVA